MQELMIRPTILSYDSVSGFIDDIHMRSSDLLITNERIYQKYLSGKSNGCEVIFHEKYGKGEPTVEKAEAIRKDVSYSHERVIAIGGGSVIDVAKLFALEKMTPVSDLFEGKFEPIKAKELVIIPTTCGTGSEVTNISILALTSKNTKKGLASDALYADKAILVPEFLEDLPMNAFATSSIDALVHAIESDLSPKANATTRMFSYRAIEMILSGYQQIAKDGENIRKSLMGDFLLASTYAGIAFGNAGCGTVHAMAYPLGAVYHVPHGESNYAMFTGVMKHYLNVQDEGEIRIISDYIADLLHCFPDVVYEKLEDLLNKLIKKKRLREYRMTEGQIEEFADSVIENQTRLLANSFVPMSRDDIRDIYATLY